MNPTDFLFLLVGAVLVFSAIGAYWRSQKPIRDFDREIRRPRSKVGKIRG